MVASSCAHVDIPDHEWCADKGTLGAHCVHTNVDAERDINKADWDNMRFGQICTNDPTDKMGSTFADMKSVIEQLCNLAKKRCTYDDIESVENFFLKVDETQKSFLPSSAFAPR